MRSVFKASPLGVSAAVEECPTPLPQPMASTTTVVRANLEEGVERLADTATEKVQRPLLCFVLVTLSLVVVVAGGGPMLNLLQSRRTTVKVAAVPEEAPRLSLH